MQTVTLTIRSHPAGETLLDGFETCLPVALGRESDTDFLSLTTGDGGVYALDQACPGVSRAHCSLETLETGHVVLKDSSTNGVFLHHPDRAAVPVGKAAAWPLGAGTTALRLAGSVVIEVLLPEGALPEGDAPEALLAMAGAAAEAGTTPGPKAEPKPEPTPEPDPEPEPAPPPLREKQLARPNPLVMVDETDNTTELHSHGVVISSGPEGLGLKVYPMAIVDDLLAQPVSAGRALVAAIGATETAELCIAASADGPEVKVNRGRVAGAPRLLAALDTIEVEGRVLRVTEPEQKYLICDNCGMANPYAHTENCTHCGTRLINSVTRIVQ